MNENDHETAAELPEGAVSEGQRVEASEPTDAGEAVEALEPNGPDERGGPAAEPDAPVGEAEPAEPDARVGEVEPNELQAPAQPDGAEPQKVAEPIDFRDVAPRNEPPGVALPHLGTAQVTSDEPHGAAVPDVGTAEVASDEPQGAAEASALVDPGQPEDAAGPPEPLNPEGELASPSEDFATASEAPPQKRAGRSRRATRPASAPVLEEPGATPEALDVLAEFAAAPARRRQDQTERASVAGLTSIVFEAPGQGAAFPEPVAEAEAEAAEQPMSGSTAGGVVQGNDTGPRLPVTALLFQAPDLAAAQRIRRAQSPAGPPSARVESRDAGKADAMVDDLEGLSDADEVDLDDEVGDAEGEDETTLEGAPAPGPGAAQRRRRRRGGRGRRSRSVTGMGAADEDEIEDVAPDQEVAVEAEPEAIRETALPSRGRGRSRRGGQLQRLGPEAEPDAEDVSEDVLTEEDADEEGAVEEPLVGSSRRRRRRRRGSRSVDGAEVVLPESRADEVTALKGSTRLEAKRQRRREGRDAGRRRTVVTEAEFLARRESVERSMVVREKGGRTQIAVLEDGVLVEHFVARRTQTSMVGNVYLGRVQNVLPSMEAAFVDLGKGRNAVLYAGEVNWDAAGMEGQPRRIEQALTSGDSVMVQVTKDPMGHKGARLTSQITLAGRYLVLVPSGAMTGISRKLPDTERARLKKLLREIVPEGAGVIVRTAAEGASEEELRLDVARLQVQWAEIERKAKSVSAPALLHGEPDLAIRVVRDVFNEDFGSVTIAGDEAWDAIAGYIESVAPDLAPRLHRWTSEQDVFAGHRIDEQLAKALDRKVWLPSGGSLVIDRTEAMTVVDVNTGKFTGAGGTLEETVTKNNLEAAEEIVRQLRLRDIGGIIVIDFIDMVLESNRDLVLRRLVECLGRDRTRHQVAEVTSLGLVQMTRKRVGQGLLEAFSEPCEVCNGRGFVVHSEPVERPSRGPAEPAPEENSVPPGRRRGRRAGDVDASGLPAKGKSPSVLPKELAAREAVKATLATIAAAAAHAHEGADVPPHAEDIHAHGPDVEAQGLAEVESGATESESARTAAASSGAAASADDEGADGRETGSEALAEDVVDARSERGEPPAHVRADEGGGGNGSDGLATDPGHVTSAESGVGEREAHERV